MLLGFEDTTLRFGHLVRGGDQAPSAKLGHRLSGLLVRNNGVHGFDIAAGGANDSRRRLATGGVHADLELNGCPELADVLHDALRSHARRSMVRASGRQGRRRTPSRCAATWGSWRGCCMPHADSQIRTRVPELSRTLLDPAVPRGYPARSRCRQIGSGSWTQASAPIATLRGPTPTRRRCSRC